MSISRRKVLLGSAGALGAASLPFSKFAFAQTEPIKIGWLAAVTGPSSAPAIGFALTQGRIALEALTTEENLPHRLECAYFGHDVETVGVD